MKHYNIYRLGLELFDAKGRSINNAQGLKLAKARRTIRREILVPGGMSLYSLHPVIQALFGWNNLYPHKFSLARHDFDTLTRGDPGRYEALCGALINADADASSLWCRHLLFENPLFSPWPQTVSFPAEDSLFLNRIILKQTHSRLGVNRFFPSPPSSGNILLERLRLDELLCPEKDKRFFSHDKAGFALWEQALSEEYEDCIKRLESFKESEPDTYMAVQDALFELQSWKKSFLQLMNMRTDQPEVKSRFGSTAKEAFLHHREMILSCQETAGKLVTGFNPVLKPVFGRIIYWYDRGDEWCVSIKCRAVFTLGDDAYDDVCGHGPGAFYNPEDTEASHSMMVAEKSPCREGEPAWLDHNGVQADPETAGKLHEVIKSGKPVCLSADGLNVMDDIGGVEGFFDFLKTINGRNKADSMWVRELAGLYGWDGKVPKPEDLLK